MTNLRIFAMPFSQIYPLYINKVERKGATKADVDEVIMWLTGYSQVQLQQRLASQASLKTFFEEAPDFNANAQLITGVICGVRVEEIENPLLQKIRYLDKLVDEVAKGKAMVKILRK